MRKLKPEILHGGRYFPDKAFFLNKASEKGVYLNSRFIRYLARFSLLDFPDLLRLPHFQSSLFLIRLRERTNGIWASMVLHATKNGVAFLALFILNVR